MAEKRNKTAGDVLANMSMPILLVALIVFFSIMSRNFLTPLNITNILVQNVHVAIVATAVMIIMISGGCDLSIGYQMSVADDRYAGYHGDLPGYFLSDQRVQDIS